MSDDIGTKVVPHNEIAKPKRLNFEQLILMMSELQDELHAHGMNEPAQLIHRALNKMTHYGLQKQIINRMEQKKKEDAA